MFHNTSRSSSIGVSFFNIRILKSSLFQLALWLYFDLIDDIVVRSINGVPSYPRILIFQLLTWSSRRAKLFSAFKCMWLIIIMCSQRSGQCMRKSNGLPILMMSSLFISAPPKRSWRSSSNTNSSQNQEPAPTDAAEQSRKYQLLKSQPIPSKILDGIAWRTFNGHPLMQRVWSIELEKIIENCCGRLCVYCNRLFFHHAYLVNFTYRSVFRGCHLSPVSVLSRRHLSQRPSEQKLQTTRLMSMNSHAPNIPNRIHSFVSRRHCTFGSNPGIPLHIQVEIE